MSMSSNAHILVVDDDDDFLRMAQWMITQSGFTVSTAKDHDQAIGRINEQIPDVVMVDRHLDEEDGIQLIGPLKQRIPEAAIILVTAKSTTDLAVQAIKLGAYDFLEKPLNQARLFTLLSNAVERVRLLHQIDEEQTSGQGFEGIVGKSSAMKTVFAAIKNVAPTSVNVMIRGESGTGKELVAMAMHRRGENPTGPFVPINMATLPAELVESTLFGHEKGAFTGADARRIGACEEAQDGTLFLDEITEMPIELQSKLLRFLQERTFRRVGGSQDIRSNARIVSATNRDPLQAIADGKLREDLYYRLNVVPVDLPSLRERQGDLPLLTKSFLEEFSSRYNKQFKTTVASVIERIETYPWPGNVRQLRHTIERAVVLHDGLELDGSMLVFDSVDAPAVASMKSSVSDQFEISKPNVETNDQAHRVMGNHDEAMPIVPLDQMEREAIINALRVCNGCAAEAARRLNISTATIYRKIKKLGLVTGVSASGVDAA